MSAAGKKNRLKMKYPMKLCPLRPATRAGQNAISTQITAQRIHQSNTEISSFSHMTLLLAPQQLRQRLSLA
jgi:hypothetical protein